MDLELAAKKLRTAQRAIEAALEAIERARDVPLASNKCSFCGAAIFDDDVLKRGIHARCYNTALGMVNNGETTWEKLEAEGLVGSPGKGGRKSKNPRLKEIYDKLDSAAADLPTNKKPPQE